MGISTKKTGKKKKVKFSSKDEMRPHSEAKVALYGKYLEKYLAILGVIDFISKINIFDVFCGTGLYANGKYGSPIVAYNAILKTASFLNSPPYNRPPKPTSLIINDGNTNSITKVSQYLTILNQQNPCCDLSFHNLDATVMLEVISAQINMQVSTERNIIFIDPTGYKEIHKEDMHNLLKSKKSEVVLFLPVSSMYRFKDIVQSDFDNPSYVQLRRFLHEFFHEGHPIRQDENAMNVFDFMSHLKDAFRFDNNYFSTSFFLKRDSRNYYALFFITSNILGLERIIDAKWEIDKISGKGCVYEDDISDRQLEIFPTISASALAKDFTDLKQLLYNYISVTENCNNCQLYEFILMKDYKPSHASEIFKEWQESFLQVWDVVGNKKARKSSI